MKTKKLSKDAQIRELKRDIKDLKMDVLSLESSHKRDREAILALCFVRDIEKDKVCVLMTALQLCGQMGGRETLSLSERVRTHVEWGMQKGIGA
jgi:hypothetical protein